MARKCRRIAKFAVAEMAQVGVRTRAQVLALAAAAATTAAATATSSVAAKKRKFDNHEVDISTSRNFKLSSHARTRRRVVTAPENSVSASPEVNSGHLAVLKEDRCLNRSSDHGSASCCSSNGTSERIEFADLKEENVEVESSKDYSWRERTLLSRRRETTPSSEIQAESSEEPDSTTKMSVVNSRRRSTAATEETPTGSELEEFFAEAEKNLQTQFADKYNYDIAKEEPLEGRYEWIRLKP